MKRLIADDGLRRLSGAMRAFSISLGLAVFIMVIGTYPPATSARWLELTTGSTFDRGEQDGSKVFELAYVSSGWFPTEIGYGHINGSDFPSGNLDQPVNYVALSKRLSYRGVFVGLGFVVTDQTSRRLSTNFNFKSQAGIGYGYLVGKVEHLSNAGIEGENDGDTFFSIGLRITFPRGRSR